MKPTGFDVSKHIRLVPPFQENEVDKYFIHCEKTATMTPRSLDFIIAECVGGEGSRDLFSSICGEEFPI